MLFSSNQKYVKVQTGIILVEVVIAATIISVALVASAAVAQQSINVSRLALKEARAAFLLEETAEAVRIIRDNAWTNISNLSTGTNYYLSYSGGTWNATTTPVAVDTFSRWFTLSPVYRDNTDDIAQSGTLDTDTKLVTASVSWPTGSGTTATKTMSVYIANIFN